MRNLSVILVAAGSSSRMGFDKLFAPLNGHPVLWYSIRAFAFLDEVSELIVVTRAERVAEVERLLRDAAPNKPSRVVLGGSERHLSVWEGLKAVLPERAQYVAIHDGARPLITSNAIVGCLALATECGAACCAVPIPDTVKRADASGMVSESVDRTGLWAMQTPQIFAVDLIRAAYEEILGKNEVVTDEVSAVQGIGSRVALYLNPDWNFKITFPMDITRAEQLMSVGHAGVQQEVLR
ncbi:MAG: 2-C-methyl-D-erythritol 4-phosphate cytidylyltransferase [Verrucomicrobiota bacterium]